MFTLQNGDHREDIKLDNVDQELVWPNLDRQLTNNFKLLGKYMQPWDATVITHHEATEHSPLNTKQNTPSQDMATMKTKRDASNSLGYNDRLFNGLLLPDTPSFWTTRGKKDTVYDPQLLPDYDFDKEDYTQYPGLEAPGSHPVQHSDIKPLYNTDPANALMPSISGKIARGVYYLLNKLDTQTNKRKDVSFWAPRGKRNEGYRTESNGRDQEKFSGMRTLPKQHPNIGLKGDTTEFWMPRGRRFWAQRGKKSSYPGQSFVSGLYNNEVAYNNAQNPATFHSGPNKKNLRQESYLMEGPENIGDIPSFWIVRGKKQTSDEHFGSAAVDYNPSEATSNIPEKKAYSRFKSFMRTNPAFWASRGRKSFWTARGK